QTHFRNHAMKLWLMTLVIAALAAIFVWVPPLHAGETRGQGDFEIFFDEAVFLRPDGRFIQEIYIRVLNSEIKFKQKKGTYQAKLSFDIMVQDDSGKSHINDFFTVDVMENNSATAQSPVDFQTVIKKYELSPGKYYVTCVVTDLLSPKMTVTAMIGKRLKTSSIHQLIMQIPAVLAQAVSMSDALFLWDIEQANGSDIFHPNPSRMYGLYKDSLETYLEMYLPAGMKEGNSLQVESIILDEKGEELSRAVQALDPTAGRLVRSSQADQPAVMSCPVFIKADLTAFPAGSYTLYANIKREDQLLGRFRCGMFSIAWDLRTWETSRLTYLAEARFLLGDKEFQQFRAKNLGEQEKMLLELWESMDPTPNVGVNEAYEEFKIRLDYVDKHYADYQQGSFTDRGLIYLKFGLPDEIFAEVIPVNRESVSDALEKIDNRFHPVSFSAHGVRKAHDSPSKDVIIDPRRIGAVGEAGNVAYPFELWVYNKNGEPILPRDRAMESDIGLRFIFIDREGYGRYKLESSSSMTDK
ncbi:MAG: GWxTD domain-containing protein, partial [Candidatus Latescibacterota bacterium]